MDIAIYKSSVTALAISIICTPILIYISRKKGFYASINHRSSHGTSVPNTGGIILCFAILIPLILFSEYPNHDGFSILISAFAVLLITGIIDDFNPIPVAYKFLGQFIPAIVIVTSIEEQELVIPFIHELIELPSVFNYLFWIVFMVMSINAFNLIDGIDGLAIGLGITGSIFYFFKFFGLGELDLMVFSVALSFGLIGLLVYNISPRNKIFIGDTGSLLVGGLLVFFALKFISLSQGISSRNSTFFLILGSIFIPLADMIRVTLVRLIHGDSPFKADRQHIHHIVVDLFHGNHILAAGLLIFCQLVVILIFQQLTNLTNPPYLFIIILAFLGYFGMAFILKKVRSKFVV